MLIRKIVSSDNSTMAAIIRASLLEFNAAKPGTVYFDETTDALTELFQQKRSAYFVIEIDHELAGGAGFFPTKGLEENTCELVKMYISKKFRSNGYGQTLLERCISEAKINRYEKMYLESLPELNNAIAMYEKNGFKPINHSLGNSGHNGCDIWMIKEL